MAMGKTIDRYCCNRLFEWVMTISLLLIGMLIVQWPESMSASAFRMVLRGVGPIHLGIFYMVIGGVRIAALAANGRWKYGRYARALGAVGGAIIWGQMDYALLILMPHAGTPPSPGLPVYFCLVIGELISCYRAMATKNEDGGNGLVR